MRFLKSIHAASKKTNFQKGMKLAQAKLYDAIPIARIRKSKLKILQNYLEQTFLENPSMPPTWTIDKMKREWEETRWLGSDFRSQYGRISNYVWSG